MTAVATQCRRYVVRGIVQGVFFRASTQQTAQRLGLTGWVRNRNDGAVELIACGEADRLEQLERWLQHGPPHAEVEGVQRSDAPFQAFSGFSIVH